jgi:hypothetical protein
VVKFKDDSRVMGSVSDGALRSISIRTVLMNKRYVSGYINKWYGGLHRARVYTKGDLNDLISYAIVRAEEKVGNPVNSLADILKYANSCIVLGVRYRDGFRSRTDGSELDLWGDYYSKESTGARASLLDDSEVSFDSDFFFAVEKIVGRQALLFFKLLAKGYSQKEINDVISIDGENKTGRFIKRVRSEGRLRQIADAFEDHVQ